MYFTQLLMGQIIRERSPTIDSTIAPHTCKFNIVAVPYFPGNKNSLQPSVL